MTGSRTDRPNDCRVEPRHSFRTDADELESIHARTTAFVRAVVDRSGADGVVVRLRGDVGSTVTAALATLHAAQTTSAPTPRASRGESG